VATIQRQGQGPSVYDLVRRAAEERARWVESQEAEPSWMRVPEAYPGEPDHIMRNRRSNQHIIDMLRQHLTRP